MTEKYEVFNLTQWTISLFLFFFSQVLSHFRFVSELNFIKKKTIISMKHSEIIP